DYVQWLAHTDYDSDLETDGCLLGYKETFRRLNKLSVHVLALEKTTCGRKNCTTLRFGLLLVAKRKCFLNISPVNSEYGFYPHENTSECLLQPDFLNQTKDICLNGELDGLQSSG
ncbi:hypothetical protein M9458_009064, partial [Cirrhinus mrigala]